MSGEIVRLIERAVHEPFRRLWERRRRTAWREVRGVLEGVASAHAEALAKLEKALAAKGLGEGEAGEGKAGEGMAVRGGEGKGSGATDEGGPWATDAAGAYHRRTAEEVLAPLGALLRVSKRAAKLEEALAAAADEAVGLVAALPERTTAALAGDSLSRARGGRGTTRAKAAVARVLPRPLRPRGSREAPVRGLARRQLLREMEPLQRGAFRTLQRLRTAWLHDLERAWSEWTAAAMAGGSGGEVLQAKAAFAAGRKLERALAGLFARTGGAADSGPGTPSRQCLERLRAEVAVAGTWVGWRGAGRTRAWRRLDAEAGRWDRLADESGARLALCLELLQTRMAAEDASHNLRRSWEEAVAGVVRRLDQIQAKLAAAHERLSEDSDLVNGVEDSIVAERARIIDEISTLEEALGDPTRLAATFGEGVERASQDVADACAGLSEVFVVHRVPTPVARVRRPGRAGDAVSLRQIATGAFHPLWPGRLQAIARVAPTSMRRVLAIVAELREVAAYGYEAALQERAESAGREAGPGTSAGMAGGGLDRAGALAVQARAIIEDALGEAVAAAATEFEAALTAIYRRATADPLAARWLDLRSGLAARVARGRTRSRDWIGRVAAWGVRAGTGVRRRLWPVRRALGIGVGDAGRKALRDRSRAEAEAVATTLPVLYRRLYSFDPLTDPRLLAGRSDALAALAVACERWKQDRNGAVMVVVHPGAGVTSFLNIAAGSLEPALPGGIRKSVRMRFRDEAPLAALLGEWLGLGRAGDLDELAARVLAANDARLPGFVIVEGIEHLHLRVAGGARLLERVVDFTARTSPRVFWVLSMTASAWQLVRKRSSACVSDLEPIELAELGVNELRRAILARHRLSGIPLRYMEAGGRRWLLMRRIRGLGGPGRGRQMAEADYFQKLHRAALGSIRSALLHWLRSADFRTVEGALLVRPLDAPPVSLAGLDTEQGFALKALLDHGALTVGEYAAVARREETEVRHRFRALQEINLIEAVPGGEGREGADARDRPASGTAYRGRSESIAAGREARYRIRPIMVGVVASHLKSANILH